MPAKKGKRPSRSIRYLLSADQRLRKISLRKITEHVKKARPAGRSRRSKAPARRKRAMFPSLAISPLAVILGLTGVLVAAALITARQPSPNAETGTATPAIDMPLVSSAPVEPAPQPARPEVRRKAPSKASVPAAQSVERPAVTIASRANVTAPVTNTTPSAEVPRSEPTASAEAQDVEVTTITGCLASDAEAFRLKDTSGADVPKSRSWKSGFLRRRPVGVTLVDPTHSLHLTSFVGRRIAVTGTLVDRELRARSVRPVASSCD